MTGLAEMSGGEHRYRAPDFDTLVDSPILLGNPRGLRVHGRRQDALPRRTRARPASSTARRRRRISRRSSASSAASGASLPYDKYLFLNMLTDAEPGGGLEHKNSTVLMTSRWTTRTRRAYLAWLELASHEFFHAWNVKRLRPVELGPFNYENEVHTRSLWIAEGVTDYYGELLVHRAGLSTRDEYLDALSNQIEDAADDARAAWCSRRSWRPSTRGSSTTGPTRTRRTPPSATTPRAPCSRSCSTRRFARRPTERKSLDDVMRAAYRALCRRARLSRPTSSVRWRNRWPASSLASFWDSGGRGHGGARLLARRSRPSGCGSVRDASPGTRASLGATTRNDAAGSSSRRCGATRRRIAAGLNVDDEILAIDDFRVRADQLANPPGAVQAGRQGDAARRRGATQLLRTRRSTLGPSRPRQWRLEVNPAADRAAQQQTASRAVAAVLS